MSDRVNYEYKGVSPVPGAYTGVAYDLETGLASVGAGWADLVRRAFEAKPANVMIDQVKEKFGALTIYTTPNDAEFSRLLSELYVESLHICEECGRPGVLRKSGWMRTLCNAHAREREVRE